MSNNKSGKRHWKETIGVVGKPSAPARSRNPEDAPTTAQPRPASAATVAESDPLAPIEGVIDGLPVGSITFADQVGKKLWHNPTPIEIRAVGVIAEEKIAVPAATRRLAVRAIAIRQRVGRLLYTPILVADPDRISAIAGEWARLAKMVREFKRSVPDIAPHTVEHKLLQAAQELLPDPHDLEAEAAMTAEMSRLIEAILSGQAAGAAVWNAPVAEVDELYKAVQSGSFTADMGLCLELFAGSVLAQRHLSGGDRQTIERDRRLLDVLVERLEARVDVLLAAHQRDRATGRRLANWRRFLNEIRSSVGEMLVRLASEQPRPRPIYSTGGIPEYEITAAQSLAGEAAPTGGQARETESTGVGQRYAPPAYAAPNRATGATGPISSTSPEGTTGPVAVTGPSGNTGTLTQTGPIARPVVPRGAELLAAKARAAAAPSGPVTTKPPAPEDAAIVDNLRHWRDQVRGAGGIFTRSGLPGRYAVQLIGLAVALGLFGYLFTLPAALPKPAPLATEMFSDALTLSYVTRAGDLLVATADPGWEQLPASERQLGATRLMSLAEAQGCSAGIIVGVGGTPLAFWSPGREPELRTLRDQTGLASAPTQR